MRLLFISTETRPVIGGISRALDGWLTGLAEAGHEVEMLSLIPSSLHFDLSSLPSRNYAEKWYPLPVRRDHVVDRFFVLRKLRSAVFSLLRRRFIISSFRKEMEIFKPDWVIFSILNELCCAPLTRALARNIQCAAIAYGSEIQPARVENPLWLKRMMRRCKKIIAISSFTRQIVSNWGVSEDRTSVVHPPLAPDIIQRAGSAFDQPITRENDVFTILTICRLIERKGVQTVLEAITELRKDGKRIHYFVIGDGPFRAELEALSQRLGVSEHVSFLGAVDDLEREKYLMRCDVFVMVPFRDNTCDVEGFGLVYLEAGLFRRPVIGSRSGGVADAVKELATGVLVEPQNHSALRDALARLFTDNDLREGLGAKGKEWSGRHTPAAIAKQFENVLCNDVTLHTNTI